MLVLGEVFWKLVLEGLLLTFFFVLIVYDFWCWNVVFPTLKLHVCFTLYTKQMDAGNMSRFPFGRMTASRGTNT